MPLWAGKWKGGRYYLDDDGREVFFIEKMKGGKRYSIRLKTHDRDLAMGELARFLGDPVAFCRPAEQEVTKSPVYITKERVQLYLHAISGTCKDHRSARRSYLNAWSKLGLDLRGLDRAKLRAALASFDGGHRGRAEALNTFANFLVREGELESWNPIRATQKPNDEARAEREAYTIEELHSAYLTLGSKQYRDLFHLRVATGLHHTEIQQLVGCDVITGPLPDRGVGIRKLGGDHEIQGVLQVRQKTKPRHRVSVNAFTLEAALRLREGVPSRVSAWKAFDPIVPSNLRHTFTTLAGEVGSVVTLTGAGVPLDQIAEILGHRPGSKMTATRYDKLQVPPMLKLPLPWM